MSESGFFQLPTTRLYKKENTKRLKNFPAEYVGNFYRNLADNVDTTQIFLHKYQTMQTYLGTMFKNIF